jgi:hypothetical protein
MAWTVTGTSNAGHERTPGPGGGQRMHAVGGRRLRSFPNVESFAHRFPAVR